MEKTSLQMEQDMIDDLEAIAKARGMNRSQVMRKGLEGFIAKCRGRGEIK